MKERLDVLLVRQGLAESREKAKAIIMSGCVYVNNQKEDKAGSMFDEAKVQLEVRGNTLRYVSRGGLKLEKAMSHFDISLENKICMDRAVICHKVGQFFGKALPGNHCHRQTVFQHLGVQGLIQFRIVGFRHWLPPFRK